MGYHKRKMKLYERIQKKDVLLVSKVALFLLFCFAAETEQDRSQHAADNEDVRKSNLQ